MTENTISINTEETVMAQGGADTDFAEEKAEQISSENADCAQGNDWQEFEERESDDVHNGQNSSGPEVTAEGEEEKISLTVYGQEVTVTKEEAKAAAQKGVAFEQMKHQLGQSRNHIHLKALENIAKMTGSTVNEIISEMNCSALVQQLTKEYGSIDEAPHSAVAKAMHSMAAFEAAMEQAAELDIRAGWQDQLRDFLLDNPGQTTIPDSVIEQAKKCGSLALAYSDYKASLLSAELEQTKQQLEMLKSEKEGAKGAAPSAESISAGGEYRDDSFYQMMKSTW